MWTAKDLLRIAEVQDQYLARCAASPLNMAARSDYIYGPSFLSDSDAERLGRIVRGLDLLRDTDTVILSTSADNGYPHTRPKALICLPAGFVSSSSDAELKQTLCHEAFHVHQRAAPGLWKAMCKAEGWTPSLRMMCPHALEKGAVLILIHSMILPSGPGIHTMYLCPSSNRDSLSRSAMSPSSGWIVAQAPSFILPRPPLQTSMDVRRSQNIPMKSTRCVLLKRE